MTAEQSRDTRLYQPENVRWLYPDVHSSEPPGSSPGIVVDEKGVAAIRHLTHRSHLEDRDEPRVQHHDIIPLIDAVDGPTDQPLGLVRIGAEGEMFVIDHSTGLEMPIEIREDVAAHELHRFQLEVNSDVFSDSHLVARSLIKKLRGVNDELTKVSYAGYVPMIEPSSAFTRRKTSVNDVRYKEPYIKRQTELHEEFAEFAGSGIHLHIDVPVQYVVQVANYLRLIAQLFNLPAQSAPFGFGEAIPRLGEVYNHDELKQHDGRRAKSIRYLARYARLDNGGVGIKQAHETVEEALRFSEQRLINQESNHPARLYGEHADIRIRFDAVDASKRDGMARVELCVLDTAAYRLGTVSAITGLLAAVTSRVQSYVARGEQGLEELHKEFPALFGNKPGTDTLTENLKTAELNSHEMSYDGFDAEIVDYEGKRVSARSAFNDLVKFAAGKDETGLSTEHRATLSRAALPAEVVQYATRRLPSLTGFYRSGIGTPADWMWAHYESLKEQPISEAERHRRMTEDRLVSARRHLALTALAA